VDFAEMKIGILTFHRCINYGSYWQARCLADGLRSLGHDAVILDHDSPRINLAEWKCAFRPTLPTPVPPPDRPRYREKIRRFFQAFEMLPLSRRFPIDSPAAMPHFDLVIVGSDEVWNLSHPWYGGYRLFYGDGIRAARLVSYAASFGNHDAPYGLAQDWSDKLKNFQRIAVRDEASKTIVQNATGREPDVVLDPCLQFPLPTMASFEEPSQRRYVAIYGHGFSTAFADAVRRWAKRKQLPLVSIGYRNDWADYQWIDAGPHEFAHFMAGSEAVATNFFHGCVFALRNRKPFVCESSWYRGNKLRNLMTKVGGENHLLTEEAPASTYDTLFDSPLASEITSRIGRLRESSRRYLDDALA
jgi:hypothetical protein